MCIDSISFSKCVNFLVNCIRLMGVFCALPVPVPVLYCTENGYCAAVVYCAANAVCSAVLILVRIMCEYCEHASRLPEVAPDLFLKLIDLLKLFNSRTCQLILGTSLVLIIYSLPLSYPVLLRRAVQLFHSCK